MDRTELARVTAGADKILFVLPMALGDFCYIEMVIRAFHERYPQIVLDVLFDEALQAVRFHRGGGRLVNPAVLDWAEATGLFRHTYRDLYEGDAAVALARAQAERYPLVASLAGRGAAKVALICREISPQGVVVAWDVPGKWWKFGADRRGLRAADVRIPMTTPRADGHIIEMYEMFFRFFADLPAAIDWPARAEFAVPEEYACAAEAWLAERGINPAAGILFLNPFAKNRKRTWPLAAVGECLTELLRAGTLAGATVVVNGLPSDRAEIEAMIAEYGLPRVYPFAAERNFFELPAMLARADLVVTVETSVMHLASLLQRPQVALMRLKTPYWRPLRTKGCRIIWNRKRTDHIEDISPEEVAAAIREEWFVQGEG